MTLLTCEDLLIKYENTTVISGLSFSVNYGDYLCIVGDNGTGKSTLLKCILGLKANQGGSILFDKEMTQKEIGYVAQQDEMNKDFPASVMEIVLSGCLNKHGLSPFYSKKEKKLAKQALSKLHIENLSGKSFQELSGGQRKRVLLARALLASGKLLLLDEPAAALDPLATQEFYEILQELNNDGMTILMVSHDIHSAIHNASHILHLSTQAAAFFGTTGDYLNSQVGYAYLGEQGNCRQCLRQFHKQEQE